MTRWTGQFADQGRGLGRITRRDTVWAHGYADRAPARLDIAAPSSGAVPRALDRAAHVTSFTSHLEPATVKGVPTHRPETLLTHLVTSPTAVRSWDAVIEWLPELASELRLKPLTSELAGRPTAVCVRAGYLLSGLRPDLAARVEHYVGGVVRFGPRNADVQRHDRTWRVVDTLLPIDPAALEVAG